MSRKTSDIEWLAHDTLEDAATSVHKAKNVKNPIFDILRRTSATSGLTGVSVDGVVIDSTESTHSAISNHWSLGFAEKASDDLATEKILKHSAIFPDFDPLLSFEQFSAVCDAKRDSAPGGDGLLYSGWATAPLAIRQTLYDCYCDWTQGIPVKEGFSWSHLWVLPKGDAKEDTTTSCVRALQHTRPLTGSNTDSKMFASCLGASLEAPIQEFAHKSQTCGKGRSMIENVFALDNAALKFLKEGASPIYLLRF